MYAAEMINPTVLYDDGINHNNVYLKFTDIDADYLINTSKDENLTADIIKSTIDKGEAFLINNNQTSSISRVFEKNAKEYYFYLVKYNKETTKYEIVDNLITINHERDLPLLPLTKRIKFDFSSSKHIIGYFNEIKGVQTNRKINFKIGLINDTNLIQNIKNQKDDSYNNLLNYARNDSGIIENIIDIADSLGYVDGKISDYFNIEDGKYYYGYFYTADEAYYSIEDIGVFQGGTFNNTKVLWSMEDSKFTWLNDQNVSQSIKDKIPENPQTGNKKFIFLLISSGLIIILFLYKLTKNKIKIYKL